MLISFSLAVTVLLAPVLGSLYPRDAYDRLYARNTYYAELEARQAYQRILAREAYAHPDLYGRELDLQPRRSRSTPGRIYARKRLRTRTPPPPVFLVTEEPKESDTPSYSGTSRYGLGPRLRARMPPPPASTLTSLPEGLKEDADTPSHSDASGSRPASQIASPFANKEPISAFARGGVGGTASTSEIEPHPDQLGRGGGEPPKRKLSEFSANTPPTDTHPDRQASGALRSELGRVSSQEATLRKSASTPSLRRMGSRGGFLGAMMGGIVNGVEDMVKNSAKRKHSSSAGVSRANSLKEGEGSRSHAGGEGGGSPTPSRASKSTLHSANSSPPGAHQPEPGNDQRREMGKRPRKNHAADASSRQQENRPPNARKATQPGRNGYQRKSGNRRPKGGVAVDTSGVKKGKHPHLERPPKRLTSTKPWNAAGLGITAVGAGVAGGAGMWSAIEAQKGANAAALSAQAGLKIANASMLSAEAGAKGANAATLSAQAGMKGSDAAQLSAEAGMKSANAAMISAQQSIKSANGTQLIGAVQLATAANNPNITNLGAVVSDVQAGRLQQGSKHAPPPPGGAGGGAGGQPPVRKRKRSYPPVVIYSGW